MQPHETAPESDEGTRDDAFRTYVEPELEVLLRVARTITPSSADAEDLVQETVIRAYRALDRFDGRHPRSWLLTILRHTNVNLNRRRRPDLVEDVGAVHGARPAFNATAEPGPEQQVLDGVLDSELEAALRALPEKFRTVLLLVDVDRLTYAEAAETLGIPVGTVMSRLNRARGRVRDRLRGGLTSSGRTR